MIAIGEGVSISVALLLKTRQPFGGFFGVGGQVPLIQDLRVVATIPPEPGELVSENANEISMAYRFAKEMRSGVNDNMKWLTRAPEDDPLEDGLYHPLDRPGTGQGLDKRPLRLRFVADSLHGLTYSGRVYYPHHTDLGTSVIIIPTNGDTHVPVERTGEMLEFLEMLGFAPVLEIASPNLYGCIAILTRALLKHALNPILKGST